jgi:glycine cleavage system H protein
MLKKTKEVSQQNEHNKITRREFLKEGGLLVGGVAMAALVTTTACNSPASNSTSQTTTSGGTTTNPNSTSQTTTSGDIYTTPTTKPPLVPIPGCTTFVATDRMYSVEHIWVKTLSNNRIVMGVTDKLQALMDGITKLQLPAIGTTVTRETSFGFSEGFKMSVDLISQVSGKVLQINDELIALPQLMNTDPYVGGWLIVVQLSKPEELKELITPAEYSDLNKKI